MSDEPTRFAERDLRGARFERCDLSGAVIRGSNVDRLEVDDPWLLEGGTLVVNGVEVSGFVDAELNRRFPGRELRTADTPNGLREAWAAVERQWEQTLARVASMPQGTVDISVDGEFSLAETLRHLVMATDVWLRKAVLGVAEPYHPLGKPHAEFFSDGLDASVFSSDHPAYDAVRAVRAERQAMVRDFLAGVTADQLAETRTNPWGERQETVAHCLRTILEEEWEHHRYAVRDLDSIEARGARARDVLD